MASEESGTRGVLSTDTPNRCAANPAPVSFSNLPSELRYQIYGHYFDSTFDRCQSAVYNAHNLRRGSNTEIFRVSRMIGEESRRIFYSRTKFAAVDDVAGLHQFLHGIGRENRLFVRSLAIRLEKFASSGQDDYDRRAVDKVYICRIFETLSLGHNLRYLGLEFTVSAFEAFTLSESIGQGFYKLQGIERVEIRYIVPFIRSPPFRHPSSLLVETPDSRDMLEHPHLMSVAAAMISTAQRPPEPPHTTSSCGEHVRSMTENMLAQFPGQITFVTRREWLANELRHAEDLQFRAICRVFDLLEEIEGIDDGIDRPSSALRCTPLVDRLRLTTGAQGSEDEDIGLTWADNMARSILMRDPP